MHRELDLGNSSSTLVCPSLDFGSWGMIPQRAAGICCGEASQERCLFLSMVETVTQKDERGEIMKK